MVIYTKYMIFGKHFNNVPMIYIIYTKVKKFSNLEHLNNNKGVQIAER